MLDLVNSAGYQPLHFADCANPRLAYCEASATAGSELERHLPRKIFFVILFLIDDEFTDTERELQSYTPRKNS